MQTSREFQKLAEQFYQDILDDTENENETIELVLVPFRDEPARSMLKSFLSHITSNEFSDEELSRIWWSTSADIIFDKGYLRAILFKILNKLT